MGLSISFEKILTEKGKKAIIREKASRNLGRQTDNKKRRALHGRTDPSDRYTDQRRRRPGMNAAVRAVVRTALDQGISCVGIRRGWNGLIASDFIPLDASSVSHIIDKGGTMLYTARSEEFMTEAGRAKALSTCKLLGLDGIVAIGGDGTFRGALALSRQAAASGYGGLRVAGIPATIDNDIGCSHYTIGFDTACNTAVECIDKLRDTMQSHERCSVVEVMGRHAGHLALYVGIAVGATAVLIPERQVDFQTDIVEKIRRARLAGTTHYMVVVARGPAAPPRSAAASTRSWAWTHG